MQTFIALLRGINVSGQKKILMADLRNTFGRLGFSNVQTYVQSGNVVFNSPQTDRMRLAESIEQAIEADFGFIVPVWILTGEDLERTIAANPFTTARSANPARLYVTFLQRPPEETQLQKLAPPEGTDDEFVIDGQMIYLYCPNGYGRTKLNNNWFESKLKVPATTRNWKTVNALSEMAAD